MMSSIQSETHMFILPSARELFNATTGSASKEQPTYALMNDHGADTMVIDEASDAVHFQFRDWDVDERRAKPQLPPISNIQTSVLCTADEQLRRRLSGICVSSPTRTVFPGPTAALPVTEMPKLMPLLEPSMQTIQNVSRRGSTMLPSDIRRSSIHDMSLSSAPSSRRESIATELDFSSRSTSPLSFHRESKSGKPIMDDAGLQTTRKEEVQQYPLSNGPTLPSCIMGEDGLEAYKRRHSIATAEPGVHTRRPRVLSMPRNRAYHSSNTMNDIPDQQSYSAPSSPSRRAKVLRPPASTIPGYPPIQRLSETVDMSTESFGLPSYGVQPPSHHPYAKALAHRRTSLLMQEAEIEPDVSRRASMPMTSLNTATDPTNGHPMHQYARPPTDLTSFAPAHHGSSSGNKQHPRDVSVPRSSEIMYSRTPELRVSHKLAERKRRKEMKELFDELRDILPVERSLKTSKWEILSRSIEYVSALKQRDRCAENEVAALRQLVAQKRDQQ